MNNLKELRVKGGYAQADIAKYLNVTQQAYSRYERGESELGYAALVDLADFYKVTIDYLLGRVDDLGMVSFQSGEAALSAEERELLRRFRSLSERSRKVVADMVAAMAGESGAAGSAEKRA